MKNLHTYKLILVLNILLLSFALSIGQSYATHIDNSIDKIPTKKVKNCFNIQSMYKDNISLSTNEIISEDKLTNLIPYVFKVQNLCNYDEKYQLNLNISSDQNINYNNISYKINDKASSILSDDIKLNDLSYMIDSEVLKANETKTFTLKLFISENSENVDLSSTVLSANLTVNNAVED